ncbi:MAG: glycoside hydrolase family 43 protein [Clostridia bacterium]|nr:glycoside hydrolase family 43 protein [Clostridia bacterium]
MKKFISLILAGLMVLSIAACNQNPVDDVENPNDQQQEDVNNNEQGEEDISPEDSGEESEDSNVQTLNIHVPAEREVVSVETPEKVLKLTVSSTGDAPARNFVMKTDSVEIPSGCTLQYDVYLETAAVGMGVFDVKIHNGIFLGADSTKVDEGGYGLDVEFADISQYAYQRWYHREFPLHNDGSTVTLSTFRFSAGGLTNGCTNVCYYDNISIVDAEGNVIFAIDEDTIAETEIKTTSGISADFEIVNDPAPTLERLSADDYLYKQEIISNLTGHDSIELTYNLDDLRSLPALYVGDSDEACFFGVRGYVVVCYPEYIYLYRCDEAITEIASQKIVGNVCEKDFGLRLEINGTEIRGYFIDDMDGVEPWPEFVVGIEDMTGKTAGIMDISSRGITLKTVEYSELQVVEADSYYMNPVHEGLADPDILYYDGTYYLYGTNGPGYRVYTSPDMVNWEFSGFCMETGAWGIPDAYWAPDVEYYNGKFYMVCTVDRNLGLAVADSPLGPFEPIGELLLGFITFDGHIFIDDDGQAYLYYDSKYDGRQYGIYGAKIDLETATIDFSTETLCVFSEEVWESYGSNGGIGGNKVTEGPFILKHNGLYYLTYSGGAYDYYKYAVGYAVSESPLGTFEKYEGNPIHIGNATIHGTGHHSFVETPGGELFIVYHQHRTLTEVELRRPCIDRVRFAPTESGIDRLETYGPTTTPQPIPLG